MKQYISLNAIAICCSVLSSLQISFTTPAPLNSAGRKGLIRRPKSYRGVNLKDFEGGLEQDLLQIKDSENIPEDQKTTTLQSNNTEALSVETELFLPPHSSEENEMEPSNDLSEPDLARKPFGRRSAPSLSQTRLARQDEISDMEVENVAESSPPRTLTSGREITVELETESTEKDEGYQEKCQEKPQDAGKGLRPSLGKEKLSPGPEDAGSIENISQKRTDTPQKQQRKHFQGNSPDEELFTPTEPLKTGLGARRSSTRTDAQLPGASQRNFSTWLSRKIVRRSVNEMVAHITKELDSIVPAVAGPRMAKVDSEEGSSLREITVDITQSPRVATPSRRASGKTPKTLEGTPFKATRERTDPQTGDRNRTKEMRNVETDSPEQILEFEAEEDEEMSESEDVEPTGSTPAFVRAKAFHCTPLLSSPRVLKEVASGSPVKQNLVQRVPKPAKKARREKREPSLPSNLVKKMFTHYVKMPVTKEALQVVDRCVNVYFKHLSNDLEAYANHARRKTAEAADLELLMRRQGLITDKTPLNVLVERHLPLEYRKLLIPIAVSGNKVIPQKSK